MAPEEVLSIDLIRLLESSYVFSSTLPSGLTILERLPSLSYSYCVLLFAPSNNFHYMEKDTA